MGDFFVLSSPKSKVLSCLFQKLQQPPRQVSIRNFSNHKWNAFCECGTP